MNEEKNKKGIDWSKDNLADALGRPDLKEMLEKKEQDWEKEFDKKFMDDAYIEREGNVIRSDTNLVLLLDIKNFIHSLLSFQKSEYIKSVIERLPKVLTPDREPPPNKLSQNQIFGAGEINMLLRVRELLEKDL